MTGTRTGAAARRRIRIRLRAGAWAALLAAALAATPAAAPAQSGVEPLVIGDDRGGRIGRRAAEIARLRASGRPVEIRGRVCLSSCTMFLGLPGTCVSPRTIFGFHGPSYYGAPLPAEDFDYWSQVIAAHYPEPLRGWYLREGRRTIVYRRIEGRELIRLGVPACAGE